MAIGAYTSAVLATKFGLPFWVALPGAMLVTAVRRRDRRHPVVPPRRRLSGARHARPRRIGTHLHLRAPTTSARRSATATSRRPTYSVTSARHATVRYYYVVMPLALAGVVLLVLHAALEHRPRVQGAARGPAGGRGRPASTCASTRCSPSCISALYAGCAGSLAGAHDAGLPASQQLHDRRDGDRAADGGAGRHRPRLGRHHRRDHRDDHLRPHARLLRVPAC